MMIDEELSIIRDNIAEYGQTNITQEEYNMIYNKAIDDFYNALAEDLIWIKERFGDDVYTDLWCDVGTRAERLKAGEESGTDNQ